MFKDKYEISLWEDDTNSLINETFKEVRLCTIGSSTMTAQWRALEPKLVEDINGTATFTFKIYYRYIDNETGLETESPIKHLLINERKVKVFWKEKWYHFVIKNIQEKSDDWSFSITCKDQFINELSKNGFNLEFSNELMNGSDTLEGFTRCVLEGTNWELGEIPVVRQETEEPVYEYEVNNLNAIKYNTETQSTESVSITGKILVYYSNSTEDKNYVDFFYNDTYEQYENSMLVVEGNYYTTQSLSKETFKDLQISSTYRAKRLVNKQLTEYFKPLDRYVNVYKGGVLGYQSIKYFTPNKVFNLIANPNNFTDISGWISPNVVNGDSIMLDVYPKPEDYAGTGFNGPNKENTHSFIQLKGGTAYKNRGLIANVSKLEEGLIIGQQYILRYMYTAAPSMSPAYGSAHVISFSTDLFEPIGDAAVVDGWVQQSYSCKKSVSQANLTKERIVNLNNNEETYSFTITPSTDIWLENIEFFKKETYEKENTSGITEEIILYPESSFEEEVVQDYWFYFDKASNINKLNKEDIVYLEESKKPILTYEPLYPDDEDPTLYAQKIGSLEIKQSNRFNILQKIAEVFECYVKFEYETDMTEHPGAVTRRIVSYFNKPTEDKGLTFVYGIDLKTIQRTVASDQIVTKTIVSVNGNAFGKHSFCTIQRASANLPKASYILNFDYYTKHGLLNSQQLFNDLYSTSHLGLYAKLHEYNTIYDEKNEELARLKSEKLNLESTYTVENGQLSESVNELAITQSELWQLWGKIKEIPSGNFYDNSEFTKWLNDYKDEIEIKTRISTISHLQQTITDLTNKTTKTKKALDEKYSDEKFSEFEKEIEEVLTKIKEVETKFFNKYSAYIQEGSWTSEDYVDDNLYYFDALSVAKTSGQPKVQYSISVIRLSALEEFKNKVFKLGEVAYIQDNSFFGYDSKGNSIREQVVVSEITSNFEQPEKDSFKIQNYKTQFEDLFQRITAQTQALQYAKSDYQRAANAITPEGTIKVEVLQSSLANNQNIMTQSLNNSIIQDNTGITVIDQYNGANQVKVTSHGIVFTKDGLNWTTGVSANGVNASAVLTGTLNTENVTILSNSNPTFSWNKNGISAYETKGSKTGEVTSTTFEKFVRFNQFGVFGVNDTQSTNNLKRTHAAEPVNAIADTEGTSGTEQSAANEKYGTEQDIWNNANFGMTWNGFFLKNKGDGVRVEVSTEKDIAVIKEKDNDSIEKIKIGRFTNDENKEVYGIRIADDSGNPVMETADDGSLWLKSALKVESSGEYSITIGKALYSEIIDNEEIEKETIINANNNFIVYSDGSILATNGIFKGDIEGSSISGSSFITSGDDGDSSVIINENGITTTNAPFKIIKRTEEGDEENLQVVEQELLIFDQQSGLKLNKANIDEAIITNATIESASIAGFKVKNGQLVSSDEASIILDGTEGKIIASNIELGTSATIKEFIQLGNSFIYNPEVNEEGLFISSDNGNVKIYDNGTAHFNKVKITDGLFEVGKIQSIGGSMLFSPAAEFTWSEEEGNLVLTFTNNPGFSGTAWVVLSKSVQSQDEINNVLAKISAESLTDTNSLRFKLDKIQTFDITTQKEIIKTFSKATLYYIKDNFEVVFGVNSGKTNLDGNLTPLRGEAISLIEFKDFNEDGDDSYPQLKEVPSLVIGNLKNLGLGIEGYGLYGNNVYLTGSLVTEVQGEDNITYAGVNTLNGVSAAEAKVTNDTSKIVFWAGADGNNKTSIQNSPFFVTEKGSLYASKGHFTGSILVDAEIESSIIKTAKIIGTGNSSIPALSICANTLTQKGITFFDKDTIDGVETLSINANNFTAFGEEFITFEKDKDGNSKVDIKNGNLKFHKKGLGYIIKATETDSESYHGIEINESLTKIEGHEFDKENATLLNLKVNGNIKYNEHIEYRYIQDKGYDIYIS